MVKMITMRIALSFNLRPSHLSMSTLQMGILPLLLLPILVIANEPPPPPYTSVAIDPNTVGIR